MSSDARSTEQDDGKRALTPKLRFPEFRDREQWEEGKLGSVCELYQPITLSSSDLTMTGEHLVYGANGIIGSHNEYNHEESEIAVTCRGATCGEVTITNPKSWITGNAMVVKPKTEALRKDFIFQYFNSHGLKSVISGSAQPQITRAGFAPLLIQFPKADEQQRIADCLSSVDELIAAQARKMDALKTHKKGLMQQLFPREGETQPRLRFPEFQSAAEWVLEPLGNLGDIITGKTPSTTASELWGGDILFITPTDISEDFKYQHATTRTVIETESTRVLPVGSVVYTCIASIGKMALTVHPSVTNQQINAVIPSERTLGEFIYYALANLTPWIKTLPASTTLSIINKTEFSKISIAHPRERAEQQRIADCLASFDHLIAAQIEKLDTLQTHKKGLMQQLFPSIEEA